MVSRHPLPRVTACLTEPKSPSHQLLQEVMDSFWLINVVDNNYVNVRACLYSRLTVSRLFQGDIFALFEDLVK